MCACSIFILVKKFSYTEQIQHVTIRFDTLNNKDKIQKEEARILFFHKIC